MLPHSSDQIGSNGNTLSGESSKRLYKRADIFYMQTIIEDVEPCHSGHQGEEPKYNPTIATKNILMVRIGIAVGIILASILLGIRLYKSISTDDEGT